MLLLADSGGTKTEWQLIKGKITTTAVKTPGINPYYQNAEQIISDLLNNFPQDKIVQPVDELFFYGAGCSAKEKQELVYAALKKVFPASEIFVNSDLLGAARALCQHAPGLACVIGTGSGSCIYDGHKIVTNIPSLGYILGDEGSGAYLGKRLLQDFLRGDMPQMIMSKLRAQYEISKEVVLENVNRRPMPGRYLASFSEFLHDNLKYEYIRDLVSRSFNDFALRYIIRYPNYKNYKIYVTGSIAYYFREILIEVLQVFDLNLGNISESPMEGMKSFHLESV